VAPTLRCCSKGTKGIDSMIHWFIDSLERWIKIESMDQ
jgi:hypothetical protein